jgi:hypothetical protein
MKVSSKIKEAKSIGSNISRDSIAEILKYYPKTGSYKVKFDLSYENDSYIDIIRAKRTNNNKFLEQSKRNLNFL